MAIEMLQYGQHTNSHIVSKINEIIDYLNSQDPSKFRNPENTTTIRNGIEGLAFSNIEVEQIMAVVDCCK